GNSGIALIGFHVLQAGAKFLAPLDRFTIGTERTEILCSRNFGNETLHELTIVTEAVGSQDHRMGADLSQLAVAGVDDGTADTAFLDNQLACGIANSNRDATLLNRSDQIIHEIDAAPGLWCMEPLHRMTNVLVGSNELHRAAHFMDLPLDRFSGHSRHAPDQLLVVGCAGNAHQVAEVAFRIIFNAGLALEAAIGSWNRTRRESGIAARAIILFDDRNRQTLVMCGNGGAQTARASADDQQV